MKRLESLRSFMVVLFSVVVLACTLVTLSEAQSAQQLSAASIPLSHLGNSVGSDTIPVSSGMLAPFLPKIPNLEFGFLYSFGKNVRTGRFTADYTLPFSLSPDSVVFGEAHAEGWDFWKRPNMSKATRLGVINTTSTSNNRVDLSFGGGYRTMLGKGLFLGANGFYDTSRIYNRWNSSGGVGLEMAATVAGDDAVDLNFNWYGNLFNKDVLVNAFRNHGGSFDVEAGYSHALFDHSLDLRLKFAGYQFDVGSAVRGWRGGADLTTRNGMFTLRYEHGADRLNGAYNTVGGFVNIGFELENLLAGQSPFTMPEPVFRSPRNLRRMLGQKVKRNWHQATQVLVRRGTGRRLIWTGIDRGRSQDSILQNVDLDANTFELVMNPASDPNRNDLIYRFRMSDNSIQNVRGTVQVVSDLASMIQDNEWGVGVFYGLGFVVGPSPMDATNASTEVTFGAWHWLDVIYPPSSTSTAVVIITLDVPSDPTIGPLVITCTARR